KMEPIKTEILVLGAGPGGYTAAFYAADRGQKVTLVEQNPRLGGICLNTGCIPSKALLHATEMLREAKESAKRGIAFGEVKIDLGNKRIMTSTEALEIRDIPTDLLIVGGGYIGMELGTVYAALGSNVVVLEALPSILTGVDPDLVRPVSRAAQKAFKEIRINT